MSNEYPEGPGYKQKGATSQEAAEQGEKKFETIRRKVRAEYDQGNFTPDEIAWRIEDTPANVRPRCSELRKMGELEPTGERRKNDSGASAQVLRKVVKVGQQQLPL